mgnify:CR=1 FL=1
MEHDNNMDDLNVEPESNDEFDNLYDTEPDVSESSDMLDILINITHDIYNEMKEYCSQRGLLLCENLTVESMLNYINSI